MEPIESRQENHQSNDGRLHSLVRSEQVSDRSQRAVWRNPIHSTYVVNKDQLQDWSTGSVRLQCHRYDRSQTV